MGSAIGLQLATATAALLAAFAVALAAVTAIEALRRLWTVGNGDEPAHLAAPALVCAFRRRLLAPLGVRMKRSLPARWRRFADRALRRAGHPGEVSPEELAALTVVSGAIFLGIGTFLSLELELGPAVAAAAAVFGAWVPLLWVRDRAKSRRGAIARALPYALDMLTLSVEAGLDFAAAVAKVVTDGRKGPLADELSITLKELRLGRIREEALRDLAARNEMPALSSFAHSLAQADRMGTPLGKVLRVLSAQLRGERTQRAEKLAAEAPVKLLLPLIGCIFPTIFLMLFGPLAYQVFLGGSF